MVHSPKLSLTFTLCIVSMTTILVVNHCSLSVPNYYASSSLLFLGDFSLADLSRPAPPDSHQLITRRHCPLPGFYKMMKYIFMYIFFTLFYPGHHSPTLSASWILQYDKIYIYVYILYIILSRTKVLLRLIKIFQVFLGSFLALWGLYIGSIINRAGGGGWKKTDLIIL